ncbi:hypothetical protein CHU98_g10087 [Xylaria longipes]|nr:hypothetical protein CHU98_g10087 [Xylaria longipes]
MHIAVTKIYAVEDGKAIDITLLYKGVNQHHDYGALGAAFNVRAAERRLEILREMDRNHPSIYLWGVGNEVGEQHTDEAGVAVARGLVDIVHDEQPTRPATSGMNFAKPNMTFPIVLDVISLNY